MYYNAFIFIVATLLLTGCSNAIREDSTLWTIDPGNLPPHDISVNIASLGPCTDNPDRTLHLNSESPIIILAHGCFASTGRFRALSEVFAFHGQQTACFTYNDRDSMMKSSSELITAVKQLGSLMTNKRITIIGHSQGGLISRKALVNEREKVLHGSRLDLRLVTISSPFAGIEAASHCGSKWAKIISLGLVIPVCYAISGDKWHEITAASDFIQKPGSLISQVSEYLKIVTNEQNTCRYYDKDGVCVEDDFVFSVEEQYNPSIDTGRSLINTQLHAGHAEIVGDRRVAPVKLISVLQSYGVMNKTTESRKGNLSRLLTHLYDLE